MGTASKLTPPAVSESDVQDALAALRGEKPLEEYVPTLTKIAELCQTLLQEGSKHRTSAATLRRLMGFDSKSERSGQKKNTPDRYSPAYLNQLKAKQLRYAKKAAEVKEEIDHCIQVRKERSREERLRRAAAKAAAKAAKQAAKEAPSTAEPSPSKEPSPTPSSPMDPPAQTSSPAPVAQLEAPWVAHGEDLGEETVFSTTAAHEQCVEKEKTVASPTAPENPSSSWDERTRYGLSLLLTTLILRVETQTCKETGYSETAKVTEGPEGYQATWQAIAQVTIFTAGMLIPINRLAESLRGRTSHYFTAPTIYKLTRYAARALFPIYRQLFMELSTCDVLSGDDTNSRVLEMRTDIADLSSEEREARLKALEASLAQTNPQRRNILLEAEEFLGAQVNKKNSDGKKKAVQCSVVIGRKDGAKGAIVFYNTERKSLGDVLSRILKIRAQNAELRTSPIRLQSDGLSANKPHGIPEDLPIRYAGCAAHARRPFHRMKDDPDEVIAYYSYAMLLRFMKIFNFDTDARPQGVEALMRSRDEEQRPLWNEIRTLALEIVSEFAPKSPFGTAGQYILNHFDSLTLYLDDPLLRPDNNRSERALRNEKLMQASSGFRKSRLGRLQWDVLRSILATCSSLRVNELEYLDYCLRNQEDVLKHPEAYTPRAYLERMKTAPPPS